MNKDIRPRNDKDQPHGYWEIYYRDGDILRKATFHNGRFVGYEEYNPLTKNPYKQFHIR